MEPNLYSVLLVGRHSSPFEIRHAYKAQSLAHHPDKTPLGSDRTEFYVIKAAYDVSLLTPLYITYQLFTQCMIQGDFTNCTLFALWAQNVLVGKQRTIIRSEINTTILLFLGTYG